ncbi:glycosyltransferase family 1 protein [Candidatus Parcubacteria bacterium]|nr:MAG: glycosyltransferase family 1 protein [Candidatus Parcubacteria bacterium]
MKIGIDARMYGNSVTGIGVYSENLIRNILELDKENEYVIFLLPENYNAFKINSPKVKKVKVNIGWYGWKEQIIYPLILLKYKLDLLHFIHFNVPILYPKKFIVTVHDITPKFFPGPRVKKSLIRRFAFAAVYYFGVKRAKAIIAVSRHTKNHLIKYYGINSEKIIVVYPSRNQNLPSEANYVIINEIKSRFGLTKPYIFYVGVWRDHKNLCGLIKAFEILVNRYKKDILLVIGGKEDPGYPEIKRAITESSAGGRIILPGFIKNDELGAFYSQAKVFAIPSFNEGFGLVALEALYFKIPVLASDTTSLPEVLGDAAIYFDPNSAEDMAEKFMLLLENEQLRLDLINKGSQVLKKYNWKDSCRKILTIYESAAK